MVAKLTCGTANNGSMADYYLKPTLPEQEFTQPRFEVDLPAHLIDGLRLDMAAMQTDPYPQMRELFAGRRGDGAPTGKRRQANYVRQDGKEFSQKNYFDITISTDISVGLAMANSATPEGRQAIYGAALDANRHAVRVLAERIGWTRQGAGGRDGPVAAAPLIATFPHHTTRPTQTGFVAPCLHFHNVAFSAVATESGRIGALNAIRFSGKTITQAKLNFAARFAGNLKNLGIDFKYQKIGDLTLTAVPNHVREFFSQRTAEINQSAREAAHKQGKDFDKLSSGQKYKYLQIAVFRTRGGLFDGIAKPEEWQGHCRRLGWTARDLPTFGLQILNNAMEGLRQAPEAKPDFTRLAALYTGARDAIRLRLQGRRIMPALAPLFVQPTQPKQQEAPKMLIQPTQRDHESLGAYLAQKNNLPAYMGSSLAAAGELIKDGRMSFSDGAIALGGWRENLEVENRVDNALSDAVNFYDHARVSDNFTTIGSYQANTLIVFANTYADAALARDATGGKLMVVTGYNADNTAQVMREWRDSEPGRQFIQLADRGSQPLSVPTLTAMAIPPANAAGADTWQQYAKSYGINAVASNMRQAFRQEFSQGMQQKQTLAAG